MKKYDFITKKVLEAKYENASMEEVAKEFVCSINTIRRKLLKYGISKKVNDTILKRNSFLTKEFLYDLYYNKENTLQEISKITGISYFLIRERMIYFGFKRRKLCEAFKIRRKKNPRELVCIECGRPICLENYLRGSRRCRKCAGKKHSKLLTGRFTGKKHHNYIDGRSLKINHCVDCGVIISWKATRCQSCSKLGKLHPRFSNVTDLYRRIRTSGKHNNWRLGVYKRDGYVCQECGQCGGDLEAHHIVPFINILDSFLKKYDNFSPLEEKDILFRLAMKYEPFWDVNNGITLCNECHKNTYSYANKIVHKRK